MTGAAGGLLPRARALLAELAESFPDGRLAVVELDVEERARDFLLAGAVSDPALPGLVRERLAAALPGLVLADGVRRLPDDGGLGERTRAVVTAAWVPVRRAPSHRAELVSQWVCGEMLQALEMRGAWLRARGPDGYLGWAVGGGVTRVRGEEATAWGSSATLLSLGVDLEPAAAGGGLPTRLPWGSRVAPGDRDGTVRLAGGACARPTDPTALVGEAERAERFPPTGEAALASARRWLGVPYVWGGRTRWGADCSGLVQSVYALHGTGLPRDSDLQRGVGSDLGVRPGELPEGEPGDLLFFAPDGGRISHVGISAGGTRLLHCSETNGCVAEDDLAGDRAIARQLRASLVAATRPLPKSR